MSKFFTSAFGISLTITAAVLSGFIVGRYGPSLRGPSADLRLNTEPPNVPVQSSTQTDDVLRTEPEPVDIVPFDIQPRSKDKLVPIRAQVFSIARVYPACQETFHGMLFLDQASGMFCYCDGRIYHSITGEPGTATRCPEPGGGVGPPPRR